MNGEQKEQEVVRRSEQHFFSMPDSLEMFLAAVCALQDYYTWLDKRGIDPVLTLHVPNPYLTFLTPALEKDGKAHVGKILYEASELMLGDFDQAVKFDPDLAYKVSLMTQKHVTQVFGIMIGSDPAKVVPDLTSIVGDMKPDVDIVLLPFPHREQVAEFLCNNRPELEVWEAPEDQSEENWSAALRGKLLIGIRSGLTYLAASAGLHVIELYPPDRHRNWVSKWSSNRYQMIYGNPADMAPDLIFRAFEAVWKQVIQRERAMGVTTA